MRARKLQEQDVEQERAAAHAFGHRLGAERDGRHGVPDRNMRRDVDLLRRVAEGPPDRAVDQRIDRLDHAHRQQERRDQDDCARRDREHGDDAGRRGAERHQRHRAGVGLVAFGDDQRAQKHEAADQRAHREQDQPEIERRRGHHRHVRRHHHAGAALVDGHVVHDRADHHQREGRPRHLGSRESAPQQRRRAEVEDCDLEEDDPEDQHVDAVRREHLIEGVGFEPVDRRPAGQHDPDRQDAADQQEHDGRDRVDDHQLLGLRLELQARTGAGAIRRSTGHGGLRLT